jgi:hypothetical protein
MSPRRPDDETELIELIRSIDVRAPETLHRRTEALIAEHAAGARGPTWTARPRMTLRVGGSLALVAAAAIALALILGGGGSSRLQVREAAALTLRAATASAPGESPSTRAQLAAAVDGVAFPYWEERFGWRASGSRSDRMGGRSVRTVFYTDRRGRRVGYAIVAGTPAPSVAGGVIRRRGGTQYRLLVENGSRVVVWLRDGHLCIVGGRGVSDATLLRLASWDAGATVA